MKGIVVTDFKAASALNAACSRDRCTVLSYHVQDFDFRADLKAGKRIQTFLFVMYDLDETVFTDDRIKPAKRTDVSAPAVLLAEEIKKKDSD